MKFKVFNPRNEVIALAMSWTSYVEKSGSGTGEIIDKCRDHGLAMPIYDPTEGFFKTIIWRNGYGPATSRHPVGTQSASSQGARSKGPSRGPKSGARVGGPERAQKLAQKALSQGAESKGRVKGPSQRGRVKRAESGRMTRIEMILQILAEPQCALGASQIAKALKMNSVTGRLKKTFWMLLDDRIIERTERKPNSRLQKYRLTAKGRRIAAELAKKKGRS